MFHSHLNGLSRRADRPRFHAPLTAPFLVGHRNLTPISIQLDIKVPRVAHTHEAPGFEGESELPLLPAPPQKSGRDQLRIYDPLARQELLFKPKNTTGDIAQFFLLFQGHQRIQRPNGHLSIFFCFMRPAVRTVQSKK